MCEAQLRGSREWPARIAIDSGGDRARPTLTLKESRRDNACAPVLRTPGHWLAVMPTINSGYEILSAMISPAIFLTANGSLIISTSNRMARIVDRIRVLNDLGDKLCRNAADLDYPKERLNHVHDQLDRLVFRSNCVRYALTALYVAFGSFVGTSLALAVDVWSGSRFSRVPTGLAVVGAMLMFGACINLVREALEALRSNRLEIKFYRDLHQRRLVDGRSCNSEAASADTAATSL
jgi:hypothetical protein